MAVLLAETVSDIEEDLHGHLDLDGEEMYCSLRILELMGVEAALEALADGALPRLRGGVEVACAKHASSMMPATEAFFELEAEGEDIVYGESLHRRDSRHGTLGG